MKSMDIIEALRTVDEGMLARAEHPLEQRRGIGNGIKIAIAAVLVIAIGVGGFLLLQNRSAPEPGPQPAYTLPVFDTQEPTDTRPLTDTQKPTDTWVSELPIAYAANWAALQKVWAEEGSLLAISNGIAVEHTVTYYGDVPEEFRDLIRRNAFSGAEVCGDRLINAFSDDSRVSVCVYDRNGKERVRCERTCDNDHCVAGMTATSDRGFLFALGFLHDRVQSSASGEASLLIKCGADGSIQWTQTLNGFTYNMLTHCFEADGAYYFFGTGRRTMILDGDPGNISLLCLNADGSVREQSSLGGAFDRLLCAAQTEDGFALYVDMQPSGDFPEKGTYLINLDTALKVQHARAEEWAGEYYEESMRLLGIVDDEELWSDAQGLPAADFPYGNLRTVVDYGDRLLTVSEYFNDNPNGRLTGEDSLLICSRGPRSERGLTVYAMFDKQNGTLLWRAVTSAVPPVLPDGMLNGSASWDEEERPLPGWRVRVPERGSDEPGDEELNVLAVHTSARQDWAQYLEQNRAELETIAKDMLRLQAQTGDEKGMKTMYFSGLQYDASAQTDVDVGALEARIRKFGLFDSVSVAASQDPEASGICTFHLTEGLGGGNTLHIQLSYSAGPQPAQTPDDDVYSCSAVLDDHWAFWCRYAPAED